MGAPSVAGEENGNFGLYHYEQGADKSIKDNKTVFTTVGDLYNKILNRIKAKTNESDRVDRARPTVVNVNNGSRNGSDENETKHLYYDLYKKSHNQKKIL